MKNVYPLAFLFYFILDRLCSSGGDAYNAMHRSFFRMLTGMHECALRPAEENGNLLGCDVPMDLLLVSGNPESPIRYLSEEYSGTTSSGNPIDLLPQDRELYSTASETGVALRKWSRVPTLTWDERAYMMPFSDRLDDPNIIDCKLRLPEYRVPKANDPLEPWRLGLFLEEMNRTGVDRRPLDPTHNHRYRFLLRVLWDNLAISNWVLTYWCTNGSPKHIPDDEKFVEAKKELHKFLSQLDRAASVGGGDAIVGEILALYEALDRKNEELDTPKIRFDLLDQIMRHLTLFALPVELWVLIGCPKILDKVDATIRADKVKHVALAKYAAMDSHEAEAKRVALRRYYRLQCLNEHLALLKERGLIVPIRPVLGGDKKKFAKTGDEELALHSRYILHGQIRAHIAGSMKMAIPAQGDNRNQQISIYCDHSNETTTPLDEHYYMVADLLDNSIRLCRESLWTASQFSNLDKDSPTPDEEDRRKFAMQATANRLLLPKKSNGDDPNFLNPNGLAGSMGRLHSVPQRLRAMMSLLRGTFSLGVMARLEDVKVGKDEATPFENYARWLRSLGSAAASLEVNSETIEAALVEGEEKSVFKSAKKNGEFPQGGPFKAIETPKTDKETQKQRKEAAEEANSEAIKSGYGAIQRTNFDRLRRPYYRDEIAWLYNERGLTSLVQGKAQDALRLFGLARFIMTHKMVPERDSKAYHSVERRILLNIAIANIEAGDIRTARGHLNDLLSSDIHVPGSTPSRLELFARGYLGLCDHLSGSLEEAENAYDEVISECSEKHFHRALAIFYRHKADLLSRRSKFDEAIKVALLADKAASEAGQQDVRHLSLISVAQAQINLKRITSATGAINRALDYGERMGIYRIQADALLMRAKLYLVLGDAGLAGTACSQAISLCNKYGLTLRKLTGLRFYAETLAWAGKTEVATDILTEAISAATQLGYQTMASDASVFLGSMRSKSARRPHSADLFNTVPESSAMRRSDI